MREYYAIVGSRDWKDVNAVVNHVNKLPDDAVVVSGGARGVDTIAVTAAKARGLDTHVYEADWDRYGKSAGFRRNHDIVNLCDYVIAFWDGVSRGTKHTIDIANKQGKTVVIFNQRGVGNDYQDQG